MDPRARRFTAIAAGVLLGTLAASRGSAQADDGDERSRGWTLRLDNDLFTFEDRDRDYTAGFTFAVGGAQALAHPLSPARALDWVDHKLGFGLPADASSASRALELGLLLFTPQDLAAEDPIFDDRPYASLLYAASSKLVSDDERGVAYQSSLTLGVIGLRAAGNLHRDVHDVLDGDVPNGYSHQISAGGEPTFRYAVTRYQRLASGVHENGRPYSLRFGSGVSVGYLTEANAQIAFRSGGSRLPWWSSSPGASTYAGQPPIPGRSGNPATGPEVLFDAGVTVRARAYNSFLQGQVRHSDVTFSSAHLNHLLGEAWIGATLVLRNDLSVSYTVRRQTEEIEDGRGARAFTWASLTFAQRF
jgi:hypothetical protein